VLCDHCDAAYGYKCLSPPLKKPPKGVWHCPDCKPKLRSAKGARMLSAVAEQAARKRAELGDTPKRHINQKMYLVKWVGLGYEHCSWETGEDLGRPDLIVEFRKLNNSFLDDPEMPEETVHNILALTEHLNHENSGGSGCIRALRTQLYAQSRAFEFAKFGMKVPKNVCTECGPMTKSSYEVANSLNHAPPMHPPAIVECVNELTYKASLGDVGPQIMKINQGLPPLMAGEYDAVVPVTSKGLMMNVGEINSSVSFLGYRQFADGTKGPAELNRVIRGVGDKIIAVDGVSTVNKLFKEVISMLRNSGKNSFAVMRFLEHRYASALGDTCSTGNQGRYAVEELRKKFISDRRQLVVHRVELLLEEGEDHKSNDDYSEVSANPDEDENSSEGSFQLDSDDDALNNSPDQDGSEPVKETSVHHEDGNAPEEETDFRDNDVDSDSVEPQKGDAIEASLMIRPEKTQSLAFRLLNMDIGYSSDEGGDEDRAYFIDGVDDTFTSRVDLIHCVRPNSSSIKQTVSVRRNEFSGLGDRSQLVAAVAITSNQPDEENFDENFPFVSKRAIEEKEAMAAAENEAIASSSLEKQTKRSTVKVEQISVDTGEIVNVWANIESAAATLQLSLNDIKRVLRGEYDDDFNDEVGGFRWQFASTGSIVTAGESKRTKKGKEAWLEFRDKLYDPNEPHIYKNCNRLRDYQVEGVNWLASTFYKKTGCILADEMGLGKQHIVCELLRNCHISQSDSCAVRQILYLGKTVQIVCYLEHLYRVEKIHGPFLVVVPLSTIEHWRREFEGWSDLVCCIYHDRQRVW
jgi:hypothetical protein